jgi:hypothetical protein
MIRPFTLVTATAAAVAGLYLYQVKYSVALLDRELREINRRTEEVRERTQVLRAEWALLNEPDRLRRLAEPLLPLAPMAPTQFVRLEELARHLPPPRDFAGPPSLFGPPPGGETPRGDVAVTAAEPAAPPARRAAPPPVAARNAEALRPAPKPPRRAAPEPPALAAAPSPPVRQAVHVAGLGSAPAAQRIVATQPASVSLLGGGRIALAPPVPIARAQAMPLAAGQ